MSLPLSINVTASLKELRLLQRKHPGKYKALQMLILIKQKGPLSKDQLATLTGASTKSIQSWRTKYIQGGIAIMLQDRRGGKKQGQITPAIHQQLSKRLHDAKGGFRSFTELQQWLYEQFNVHMKYHALNKYVKRKFAARLKVSRKSHVHKDPADEAVFKKTYLKNSGHFN